MCLPRGTSRRMCACVRACVHLRASRDEADGGWEGIGDGMTTPVTVLAKTPRWTADAATGTCASAFCKHSRACRRPRCTSPFGPLRAFFSSIRPFLVSTLQTRSAARASCAAAAPSPPVPSPAATTAACSAPPADTAARACCARMRARSKSDELSA